MATPTGAGSFAAAPTDIRRYLGYAVAATCLIAGAPLWVALNLGDRLGGIASVAAVVLSIGLAWVGNRLWQRHPGSRDIVFNDLMLWGFLRRLRSQRGVSERAERLGLSSYKSRATGLTVEERVRLLKKLALSLEDGDPYTHGHSQRVARHSYMIAKAMRLPRREREKIRLAAIVHDVGKLRIPKYIINKPGALTDDEYEIIKSHSAMGAEMVAMLEDPELTRMVREHHERLDGTGYPDHLNASEISLGARIIAVADTFDAASSERPYRAARPHKEAIDILRRDAGVRLDAAVVGAFLGYYSGRRSVKWWAAGSIAPVHLREIVLLFAQRLGTTGVTNAAVVGATALALSPVSAAPPPLEFDSRPMKKHSTTLVAGQTSNHAKNNSHSSKLRSVRGNNKNQGRNAHQSRGSGRARGPQHDRTRGADDHNNHPGAKDNDKVKPSAGSDHDTTGVDGPASTAGTDAPSVPIVATGSTPADKAKPSNENKQGNSPSSGNEQSANGPAAKNEGGGEKGNPGNNDGKTGAPSEEGSGSEPGGGSDHGGDSSGDEGSGSGSPGNSSGPPGHANGNSDSNAGNGGGGGSSNGGGSGGGGKVK